MKITKVTPESFRAFDEPFELDCENGKNILLYGENGSGKSSLYLALRQFFDMGGHDIKRYRNTFSADPRLSSVRISFVAHGGAAFNITWDASGHPGPVPADPTTARVTPQQRAMIIDGARRGGFVDYRMLLRTHLFASPLSRYKWGARTHDALASENAKGIAEQFFDLAAWEILAGVRTTIAGGRESTIGNLIQRVWSNPPSTRRAGRLNDANAECKRFNDAFNGILPELEAKFADYMSHFDNHNLNVRFRPVNLFWDKVNLKLTGAELVPEVEFSGKPIAQHHEFLNEARLSAIAICLFLAGVSISNSDPDNPDYPRFLILDDALIGLELQNRLPILNILKGDEFKHYQIFLLTHDKVWYDLARSRLPVDNGWLHKELLADDAGGKLVPRVRPSDSDIERARAHLANGDLPAAAVYARAAFEERLRNVCEDRGIRVSYKKEQRQISVDKLWQGIVERQKDRVQQQQKSPGAKDFISPQLQHDVETVRSTVLNQLSHAGAPGLVRNEVATAIDVIEQISKHDFPKA